MIISTYLRDQLQKGEISINQARKFIGQEEMQLHTAYQPIAKNFQWFLFLSSMISVNSIESVLDIISDRKSKISSLDKNYVIVARREKSVWHFCKLELVATGKKQPMYEISVSFQKKDMSFDKLAVL